MSLESRASSSLAEGISKVRELSKTKVKLSSFEQSTEVEKTKMLPRPPGSKNREEVEKVLTLEVPRFDPGRTFPGLAKQKLDRKDRHIKALDEFSKLLDDIAERLEQQVLQFSVEMRESVENIDASLQTWYTTLDEEEYLTWKSEDELKGVLRELRGILGARSGAIDTFERKLDDLETKRADIVGAELKKLVDKLIGIAHQLPDEVEHIVESETFDLNSIVTKNRQAHAELLCILCKMHAEKEVETVQRWEDSRRKWRNIRHKKALKDFDIHVQSPEFTDPDDRQQFMHDFRRSQQLRQDERLGQLNRLGELRADSINQATVVSVQGHLTRISEEELNAIQGCYNSLTDLRTGLRLHAEDRVENLRKELHLYGALEAEPDLFAVADVLQITLDDSSLAELFRLGGGLKPEFQGLIQDLHSDEVVYNSFVGSIQQRFEWICSGFGLRKLLEDRGRLVQLDRVRTLLGKMRSVVRAEVADVIKSLLPDLEEIVEVEAVPGPFRGTVSECIAEMKSEIERVDTALAAAAAGSLTGRGSTARMSSSRSLTTGTGTGGGGSSARATGLPRTNSRSAMITTGKGSATSRGTGTGTARGRSSAGFGLEPSLNDTVMDPLLVKAWGRRLGVLYYGCDLPLECQQACLAGMEKSVQKLKCNIVVDQVVSQQSDKPLAQIDKNYKKLIDSIATFLEAQENYQVNQGSKLAEFYLQLAKLVEGHRKAQSDLDEKLADEMWDLSEEFRLEREDREQLFEQLCEILRQSVGHEQLQENFQKVLDLLTEIENSYRIYHGKACFGADKYPLSLIDEFKQFTISMAEMFGLRPQPRHPIMVSYDYIWDETLRLNKQYLDDADPSAAGVKPRETIDSRVETTASPPADDDQDSSRRTSASVKKSQKGGKPSSSKASSRPTSGSVRPTSAAPSKPSTAAGKKSGGGTPRQSLETLVSPPGPTSTDLPVVFDSPNLAVVAGGDAGKLDELPAATLASIRSNAGRFVVKVPLSEVVKKFSEESSAAVEEEGVTGAVDLLPLNIADAAAVFPGADAAPAAAAAAPGTRAVTNAGGAAAGAVDGSQLAVPVPTGPARHTEYVFLLADVQVKLLTAEQIDGLDKDELEEYKEELARAFLPLDEAQLVHLKAGIDPFAPPPEPEKPPAKGAKAGAAAAPPAKNKTPAAAAAASIAVTDSPAFIMYNICEELVRAYKVQRAIETDSAYIRARPPICDANHEPWVLSLEMSPKMMEEMLTTIRDSLVVSVEKESYVRIEKSNDLTSDRKTELTGELEDRLRTHWPRRGRVETQIKQPREAELLGHEEKTWRHIRSIQQRMLELQKKFIGELSNSTRSCDNYVKDVTGLRNALTAETHRSLAALQVFDVKARKTTIDFKQLCVAQVALLDRMSAEDTAATISFALEFRKVCPPQQPGVEGGYSEAELEEIEALVKGQCEEIKEVAVEWNSLIEQLKEQQGQSLKSHDEFLSKYEKVSLDLAMSEGLGQKYGAPRRRAQEKLRTSITRDEHSAGTVDELLARLDFFCKEAEKREDSQAAEAAAAAAAAAKENNNSHPESSSAEGSENVLPPDELHDEGRQNRKLVNDHWNLLLKVRSALQQRADFLKVIDSPLSYPDLPWATIDRFIKTSKKGGGGGGSGGGSGNSASTATSSVVSTAVAGLTLGTARGGKGGAAAGGGGGEDDERSVEEDPTAVHFHTGGLTSLDQLFEEVESACRLETRDLYSSEGKVDALGPKGIPDSLQQWLDEAKLKLLGSKGYREKAWKRLWDQTGRFELILARKQIEGEGEGERDLPMEEQQQQQQQLGGPSVTATSTVGSAGGVGGTDNPLGSIGGLILTPFRVGAPAACMRLVTEAMISLLQSDRRERERDFSRLVKMWEMGREKHERMLRPRLGSPDCAEELAQLDRVEGERSVDFSQNVLKFRGVITRRIFDHARHFLEDLAACSRGLMMILDSTIRREVLQVPPDTAVPKKRMTLKRMRKAQRLREEVAKGSEDRAQDRIWPSISLEDTKSLAASTEDVLKRDLLTFDSLLAAFAEGEARTAAEKAAKAVGAAAVVATTTRTSLSGKSGKAAAAAAAAADKTKLKSSVVEVPKESAASNTSPSSSSSLVKVNLNREISLLPPAWAAEVQQVSAVRASVTTAHRTLLTERDDAVARYTSELAVVLEEIVGDYGRLLTQEASWKERWNRQVKMLKKGSL